MPRLDDLYWNSIDFSIDDDLLLTPTSTKSRPYVDPWDLENYAYIQKQMHSSSQSDSSEDFHNDCGEIMTEANSTSFYYVPGISTEANHLETNGNYADIDEIDKNLYVQSDSGVPLRYTRDHYRYEFDSEEFRENPYEENLKGEMYVYEFKDKSKKFMAVPHDTTKTTLGRDRSLSFSYGEHGHDSYASKDLEIYSKLEDYDDLDKIKRKPRKPRNFSLTNYGHLKIDYSYSWNNLDRYICN